MKTLLTALLINLLLGNILSGQTVPFGTNTSYPNGIMPTNATVQEAEQAFTQWKEDFVTSENASGFLRVKYPTKYYMDYTVSEGIGYGMILAAYYGDQDLFDKLFNFSKIHRNNHGLMCWKIPHDGITPPPGSGEYNAATDADEDFAFGLILGHYQWGSAGNIHYQNEAKELIDSLYKWGVQANTHIFKPGDVFGGEDCVNASYLAPSYYPMFAQYSDNNGWNSVLNKSLQILDTASTLYSTGLIGDWSNQYGGDPSGECAGRPVDYGYDACRIPWRCGLDYLWNGRNESKLICSKIIDWTLVAPISGNAGNIFDEYYKNGTQKGNNKNNPIIACLQTGAMVTNHQNWLNQIYTENLSREDEWFFNRTLKVISLFVATGNFWQPEIENPGINDNIIDESGVIVRPNPFLNEVYVIIQGQPIIDCLTIYNKEGQIIKEFRNTKGHIFLEDLGKGVYFLHVKVKDQVCTRKMIKL